MSKPPNQLNPTLNRALRFKRVARSIDAGCAMYEQRKAAWIYQHPDADYSEYDAAMIRIARECGV